MSKNTITKLKAVEKKILNHKQASHTQEQVPFLYFFFPQLKSGAKNIRSETSVSYQDPCFSGYFSDTLSFNSTLQKTQFFVFGRVQSFQQQSHGDPLHLFPSSSESISA